MNETAPAHETPPEPQSTTSEVTPIRKSQEEFIDDTAGPSIDRSEYEPRPDTGTGEPSGPDQR